MIFIEACISRNLTGLFHKRSFSYLPEARLSPAAGMPAAPIASMKELEKEINGNGSANKSYLVFLSS